MCHHATLETLKTWPVALWIYIQRRHKSNQRSKRWKIPESESARSAAERAESQEMFRSSVNKTFDKYQSKIPTLLDNEGNATKEYGDMVSKAESLVFEDMDTESKSFAAMSAVMLPHLVSQYKSMELKLKEANTLVGQMRASNPSSIPTSDATTATKPK